MQPMLQYNIATTALFWIFIVLQHNVSVPNAKIGQFFIFDLRKREGFVTETNDWDLFEA